MLDTLTTPRLAYAVVPSKLIMQMKNK